MELEEKQWYYTPVSHDLYEAWSYVDSINDAQMLDWYSFLDQEDGSLRIVDERLGVEVAQEEVEPMTGEHALKLIALIFSVQRIEDQR